jgi:hypothetical protein
MLLMFVVHGFPALFLNLLRTCAALRLYIILHDCSSHRCEIPPSIPMKNLSRCPYSYDKQQVSAVTFPDWFLEMAKRWLGCLNLNDQDVTKETF